MLLFVCMMLLLASEHLCLEEVSLDDQWEQWKKDHNKKYKSDILEESRKAIWEKNMHMIEVHNQEAEQGKHSYKLGMNHRGDVGVLENDAWKVLFKTMSDYRRRNEILEEMSDTIAEYDRWAEKKVMREVIKMMSKSVNMTRKQILVAIVVNMTVCNEVASESILEDMEDTLDDYNKTTRKQILEEMSEMMTEYYKMSRQLITEKMSLTTAAGRMSQSEILEDLGEAMTEDNSMSRKLIVEEMAATLAKYDRMARKQETFKSHGDLIIFTTNKKSTQEFCTSSEKTNITDSLPRSVDLREEGLVSPVKDQGSCGSCWAFSAAGALEGQLAKKTGQLLELSTQNLVDCVLEEGCDGGYLGLAYKYVIKNGGMNSERDYPYVGKKQKCRYKPSAAAARCKGFRIVPRGDEHALAKALNEVGPLSVSIDTDKKFSFYKSGIYYNPEGVTDGSSHAVLLVGYGETERREKYWIVKNSWGEGWGEGGYVRIARNCKNHSGIASAAMYPLM